MVNSSELKDEAIRQTGLTDFGADSFDEGLAILLNSLDRQARLNARGEAFIYGRITGYLAQRLQVEDWYRRHPEIDDGPILAPVIGLGTSAAHWVDGIVDAVVPGAPTSGICVGGSRRSRARHRPPWSGWIHASHPTKGEMIGTRYHVPTDTHAPMECHELMALDFASHIFQSFAQIPAYSEWLVEKADRLDVGLPASGDEAAAVGRAGTTLAAALPVARVVAGRRRHRPSRRQIRDDSSRPDRCHLVGGRSVRRHHRLVHR